MLKSIQHLHYIPIKTLSFISGQIELTDLAHNNRAGPNMIWTGPFISIHIHFHH